ncbi:unnamed protein product [Closterium sp. NIES-64]|nr:unnamed protein product [Closterium sp. NIES-64]
MRFSMRFSIRFRTLINCTASSYAAPHARTLHRTLMLRTARSYAAPHAHMLHRPLIRCTARSYPAPPGHALQRPLICCTARSYAAPHAHKLHRTLIRCTARAHAAPHSRTLDRMLIRCTARSYAAPHAHTTHRTLIRRTARSYAAPPARTLHRQLIRCTARSYAAPHAHTLHRMLIRCIARSYAAPHAHTLHLTLIRCTARSYTAPPAHTLHRTLIRCIARSYAAPHAHTLYCPLIRCTARSYAAPPAHTLHRTLIPCAPHLLPSPSPPLSRPPSSPTPPLPPPIAPDSTRTTPHPTRTHSHPLMPPQSPHTLVSPHILTSLLIPSHGIGAFVFLIRLSWQMALVTAALCGLMWYLLMVYGSFSRRSSMVVQDTVAAANEVAEETLSLARVVRTFGTESKEVKRYEVPLQRIVNVGLRRSVAYGVWTCTGNTIYNATQACGRALATPSTTPRRYAKTPADKNRVFIETCQSPHFLVSSSPRWSGIGMWTCTGNTIYNATQACGRALATPSTTPRRYAKTPAHKNRVFIETCQSPHFLVSSSPRWSGIGMWTCTGNTIYNATQVLALIMGGGAVMAGRITAEQLTQFILYAEWVVHATWWVGDHWASLMDSVGACHRVFQLLDLPPSEQLTQNHGRVLPSLKGKLEFRNLSFRYPTRPEAPVLDHINLTIQPGELVALVGLSGSGKSTLVGLLQRLYEPTEGQVLIDDVPLPEIDIAWLRSHIGVVSQEPRLFSTDVASNIAYGSREEISQEKITRAATQANVHQFVSGLPEGYDTVVDNARLSGGQKQRIAIARALVRDPTLLILDEATSALDAESEHYVQMALDQAMHDDSAMGRRKRTIIVIAHRLSTIRSADRIVVMSAGKIVESHDQRMIIHLIHRKQPGAEPPLAGASACGGATIVTAAAHECADRQRVRRLLQSLLDECAAELLPAVDAAGEAQAQAHAAERDGGAVHNGAAATAVEEPNVLLSERKKQQLEKLGQRLRSLIASHRGAVPPRPVLMLYPGAPKRFLTRAPEPPPWEGGAGEAADEEGRRVLACGRTRLQKELAELDENEDDDNEDDAFVFNVAGRVAEGGTHGGLRGAANGGAGNGDAGNGGAGNGGAGNGGAGNGAVERVEDERKTREKAASSATVAAGSIASAVAAVASGSSTPPSPSPQGNTSTLPPAHPAPSTPPPTPTPGSAAFPPRPATLTTPAPTITSASPGPANPSGLFQSGINVIYESAVAFSTEYTNTMRTLTHTTSATNANWSTQFSNMVTAAAIAAGTLASGPAVSGDVSGAASGGAAGDAAVGSNRGANTAFHAARAGLGGNPTAPGNAGLPPAHGRPRDGKVRGRVGDVAPSGLTWEEEIASQLASVGVAVSSWGPGEEVRAERGGDGGGGGVGGGGRGVGGNGEAAAMASNGVSLAAAKVGTGAASERENTAPPAAPSAAYPTARSGGSRARTQSMVGLVGGGRAAAGAKGADGGVGGRATLGINVGRAGHNRAASVAASVAGAPPPSPGSGNKFGGFGLGSFFSKGWRKAFNLE